MRRILGAVLVLSLLILLPLGFRHLIFLKITQVLSSQGSFAYAQEKFSKIRVLELKGPNYRIQELAFLIVPSFPGIKIQIVGRGGEVNLGGSGQGSFEIPSLVEGASLRDIEVRGEWGRLKIRMLNTSLNYDGRRISISSPRAVVQFGQRKIKGAFSGVVSPDGGIESFTYRSPSLVLKGRAEGSMVKFRFSLDPSSTLPWIRGKLRGKGVYRSGVLELDGEGNGVFIYRGRLEKISFHLRKGKKLTWRIETRAGDLVLGRDEQILVSRLLARTLARISAFPLKPDFTLRGRGSWSGRTLKFLLRQREGGKVSLLYRPDLLSLKVSDLHFNSHILNLEYSQKAQDYFFKVKASTSHASSFVEDGGKIYRYFTGESLFQPVIEGSGHLILFYKFHGKKYQGEGKFQISEGKAYNYRLRNLAVSWRDNNMALTLKGGFQWKRGKMEFSGTVQRGKGEISYRGWGMMEDVLKAAEVETEITGKIQTLGKVKIKGKQFVISGTGEVKKGKVFGIFPFSGKGNYTLTGEDFSSQFYGKIYEGVFRGTLRSSPGHSTLRVSVEGAKIEKITDNLTGVAFADILSESKEQQVNTTLSARVENFGYPDDIKGNVFITGAYRILPDGRENVFLTSSLSGRTNCKVSLSGKGKGTIQGKIKATCPQAGELLPWHGSRMSLSGKGEFTWKKKKFDFTVNLHGKGPVLTLLSYPQPVENFSISATIENERIKINSVKGLLGGGKIEGSGLMVLSSPLKLDLDLRFKDCELYPFRGVEGKGNARIFVRNIAERINIGGELVLQNGKWEREFEQPLEFSSKPAGPLPPWVNRIFLNLNIRTKEGVRIKNSWGNLLAFPDIMLMGPVTEPTMSGVISLASGFIWVSERRFTIKEGKVYLSPGVEFDPYIDIDAEALIKHYRVEMKIQGLLSHMHVSLSSSPPLPTHELFSLLALGESFQRGISKGSSAQITSSSLISQALSTRIGKKARSFLGLSRLSISPTLVQGTSLTSARLTAEKQVGEKLTVAYSMDLSGAKKGIIVMEYKVNPSVSLVLTKDEKDNYIIDIIYYPPVR